MKKVQNWMNNKWKCIKINCESFEFEALNTNGQGLFLFIR